MFVLLFKVMLYVKQYLFSKSLLDTTIQDGSIRKKRNVENISLRFKFKYYYY